MGKLYCDDDIVIHGHALACREEGLIPASDHATRVGHRVVTCNKRQDALALSLPWPSHLLLPAADVLTTLYRHKCLYTTGNRRVNKHSSRIRTLVFHNKGTI